MRGNRARRVALRRRPGRQIILWGWVLAIGTGLAGSCRHSPVDALRHAAPALATDAAQHLVADDDSTLARFARGIGLTRVTDAYGALLQAPPLDSAPRFVAIESLMAPAVHRLDRVFGSEFGLPQLATRTAAYERFAVSQRMEIVRAMLDYVALERDRGTAVAERARRYRALIDRAQPFAAAMNLGDLYAGYAALLPYVNKSGEVPHYLRLAIEAAQDFGDDTAVARLLGTLGEIERAAGHEAAMRQDWDRGLALAHRCRSVQEARILSFYAAYYRTHGQVAMARDLILRAQEWSHEIGDDGDQIRFLFDELQLSASLECWDAVRQQLQRVDVLLRQGKPAWSASEYELWDARAEQFRSVYARATGQCAEARRLALEVEYRFERLPPNLWREAGLLDAARVLAACGASAEARRILDASLARCRTGPSMELGDDVEIASAELRLASGDLDGCAADLAAFRGHLGGVPTLDAMRNGISHDVLVVRLARAAGDRTAALAGLETALARLPALRRELGDGPEAPLILSAAEELRDLAHDLLDDGPERGYAFEMAWRRAAAVGSRFEDHPPVASVATFRVEAPDRVAAVLSRLGESDAVHCVYRVRAHEVVRWTAADGRVTQDTLAIESAALEAGVARVRAALSEPLLPADGGRGIPVPELHTLAERLLPPCILHGSRPRLLLISDDGVLARLPFEALSLAADRFAPLVAQYDVATLRYWGQEMVPARGPAVLVSQPAYAVGLRRRYSILSGALPCGTAEAAAVHRLLPNAVLLTGATATKRELMQRWQHAPLLYLASHVIRDPEVPYVGFIPLATALSGREEESYLEFSDIHGADLSRCRLVVLSGCSSGENYVSGRTVAPSMGDAFIDAGAQAVVQTLWSVGDDHAARLMHAFAAAFRGSTLDPVRALSGACRQAIRDGLPPETWAGYTVTIAGLAPSMRGSPSVCRDRGR